LGPFFKIHCLCPHKDRHCLDHPLWFSSFSFLAWL
jgi:hypothetical protein